MYIVQQQKRTVIIAGVLAFALFGYLNPQKFADVWLTPDQQGQILFELGNYQQASSHFSNIRWQAYSLYAAEEFDTAATLFNQIEGSQSKISRANALAHARRYVKASNIYEEILSTEPGNETVLHNLKIVQTIIDDVNRLSESQRSEEGDSVKELGDKPQTGDGAEKNDSRKQIVEQLDAEQLLLDPALNEMWLRQVQKDPALFLANKFYIQHEKTKQSLEHTNK